MVDLAVRRPVPARVARTAFDVLPSIVLAGLAAHEQLYNHSGALTWVTAQTLVWVLVLRRRFPELVLASTLVLAAVGWLHGELLFAHLGVLVALHAVASRRTLARSLLATLLVEAGAVVVAARFGPAGSTNDALLLLTGLVLFTLLIGTTQRTQLQLVEALRDRTAQLERQRHQQAQLAAADERARIAREMHDIIAHSVAVMIAMSEGAAASASARPEEAGSSMRLVAATGREALGELRRVLSVLSTDDPDAASDAAPVDRSPQPGLGQLPKLADDVRAAGLAVDLEVSGDPDGPAADVQATAYRVVQEALTNTLKHAAGATCATVRVSVRPERVSIRVVDDGGSGAPALVPDVVGGSGLNGMRERVRLHGGSLEAGPSDGGWGVEAALLADGPS